MWPSVLVVDTVALSDLLSACVRPMQWLVPTCFSPWKYHCFSGNHSAIATVKIYTGVKPWQPDCLPFSSLFVLAKPQPTGKNNSKCRNVCICFYTVCFSVSSQQFVSSSGALAESSQLSQHSQPAADMKPTASGFSHLFSFIYLVIFICFYFVCLPCEALKQHRDACQLAPPTPWCVGTLNLRIPNGTWEQQSRVSDTQSFPAQPQSPTSLQRLAAAVYLRSLLPGFTPCCT